jgi:hypothetical protein
LGWLRILRGLFGPKMKGVPGEWRKLHNEELHDFYRSPAIVRVIESRRMGWTGAFGAYGGGERRVEGFVGET